MVAYAFEGNPILITLDHFGWISEMYIGKDGKTYIDFHKYIDINNPQIMPIISEEVRRLSKGI